MLEKIFEALLVRSRIVTILPVVFGLIGSFVLFFIASYDVLKVVFYTYTYFFDANSHVDLHEDVVALIIGAVDLYLMALVLFIFSFGVYELFISEIEEFKQAKQSKVLEVHSLDQLKNKARHKEPKSIQQEKPYPQEWQISFVKPFERN